MYFYKILCKVFTYFLIAVVWTNVYAQSIPEAPAELEFANIAVQLTPSARQRLQQSLNALYADRALLVNQLGTLNQLRPVLDLRLTAQRVPLDFRYASLPFVESLYDPYAYWGLDKRQAEQLHLLVNQSVDDRRHVLIATDAVLPYLSLLRQQKGHWMKALFQHLNPLVRQGSAGGDANHWLLDLQSPAAIWTVLARKIAFEHEQALLRLTPPFVLLDYNEGAGKTLTEIAVRLNINSDRLSPYNTWLLTDRIPTSGNFPVILRLTPEEYLSVKSRLTTKSSRSPDSNQLVNSDLGFPVLHRFNPANARQGTLFYQINGRRGIQAQLCDNAITLAYYGKKSIPRFLTLNDLPTQDITLRPGEVYYLQRKAKRAKIPFHVIRQGQTLWDVAAAYGIRLKSLLYYNRLKPNQRVQTGRIIWMQRRRPATYPVEYQSVPPVDIQPVEQPPLVASTPPPASDSTKLALNQPAPVVKPDTTQAPVTTLPAPPRKDSVAIKPVQVATPAPTPPPVAKPVAAPPVIRGPLPVTKVHVVKPGQTYFSIAKLYGTTVEQLCAWNSVSVRDPLLVGQELRIDALGPITTAPIRQHPPIPKAQPAKPILPAPAAPRNVLTQYYIVKPGETVYRIALNHAISVETLMRWNKLTNFTIAVGQRLIVRQQEP